MLAASVETRTRAIQAFSVLGGEQWSWAALRKSRPGLTRTREHRAADSMGIALRPEHRTGAGTDLADGGGEVGDRDDLGHLVDPRVSPELEGMIVLVEAWHHLLRGSGPRGPARVPGRPI